MLPLIGEAGLLPACAHVEAAPPTLFALACDDTLLLRACELGLVSSVGLVAGIRQLAWPLWALQLSLMHVGQVFWGYGWELLLAETSFLAAFAPSRISTWLWRWLSFRLMFGAGLIKLRGADCWWELSCLDHHFETQPLPDRKSVV